MVILVIGKDGQVGRELQKKLADRPQVYFWGRHDFDLLQTSKNAEAIIELNPSTIINAAAFTAVDDAETSEALADRINHTSVGELAMIAARIKARLIHFSTDYVFDGKKQSSYSETDIENPINIYGKTKLLGEQAVIKANCDFLILRTSWVYSATGKNFARTILNLARTRKKLEVVDDQVGTPTSAGFVARMTAEALDSQILDRGVYHLSPRGFTSWFGLTKRILEKGRVQPGFEALGACEVTPVTSAQFATEAARPARSVLSSDLFFSRSGLSQPSWEEVLDAELPEIMSTLGGPNG